MTTRAGAAFAVLFAIIVFLAVTLATIALVRPWTSREAAIATAFFVAGFVASPLASWVTRRLGL